MILRHLITAAVRISHRPSRGLHKYRAATTTMAKSETACIFCKICRGENKETRIFYQDEELVVFKDHKPAATHHYLVCPKDHIPDPKSLTKAHLGLVERMIQVGNRVLQENCGNTDDVRMGFHWPPFNLVRHLHLHVISPQGHMGWVARAIFLPDSYWFVSEKWMLERLRKMEGES